MRNTPRLSIAIGGFLVLLASCKDGGTQPPPPFNNAVVLGPENYHAIVLQLIDYDVIRITHQAALSLSSPSVRQVEVGTKTGTLFLQLGTFPSTYDAVSKTYTIQFDFTVDMDSSQTQQPLTVRYRSNDSVYVDVDTSVALFKYPYTSARVFADSTLTHPDNYQDVARTESKLFFHTWSDGLHQYDLITHQLSEPYPYRGGSHIAADSSFVFCDINHRQVVRFNLTTNVPDLTLLASQDILITGVATQNSCVYVLVAPFYGSPYLKRFSFDGALRDSIPYPSGDSYFLAMSDSILYQKYYLLHGNQISRFSLRTRTFLSNVLSPARQLEGMEIFRDTLYYCDMWKNLVGAVPIADLLAVE